MHSGDGERSYDARVTQPADQPDLFSSLQPDRAVHADAAREPHPTAALVAATDGSCLRNPGPGGWCWYVNDDCWGAGGEADTTNNRMELLAVAALLESLPAGRPVHIMADSSYVIDALTKWRHGWKRQQHCRPAGCRGRAAGCRGESNIQHRRTAEFRRFGGRVGA